MYFTWWHLLWALIGAFGTAALHKYTGRDPRPGGLIGLAVGGILGPFFLAWLWVWLYYTRGHVVTRSSRREWFLWFWPWP